jgi:hypothetical protein
VGVQTRCENLNVKLVILVCVYTKVLDLIERNRLVFGCRSVGWRVVLRICAESTNIYLASGDGTIGVDLHAIKQQMGDEGVYCVPQLQQMGPGTFGSSSEC